MNNLYKLFLSILFMAAFSSAQQWHVSTTGSDSNDGSEESPFATIQHGIDAASDGDTVLIHPGIYEGAYLYNKNINLFSLYSTTGDTSYISNTVIDGGGDGCPLMIYGNIDESTRISGFTIQNGAGCVFGQGGGLYIEGSPVVDNMVIKDNNAQLNGGGICVNFDSSPTFRDLIVKNNTGGLGGGVYVTGSTIDMENCLISNNSTNGEGGGVFISHASSSPNLVNVTITGNTAAEAGGGIYCENSSPSLVNSILWNNLPEEIDLDSGSVVASYSDIKGGWEGEGNIDADPLFCNADSSDFTLYDNSPCVGTGQDGANMGAYGIGCEYNTSPVMTPIDDQTMEEDTSLEIYLYAEDVETGEHQLMFSASSDNEDVDVSVTNSFIDPLIITPSDNYFGSAVITATVIDEGGLTDSTSFNLTINPVNDAPYFTMSLEDTVFVDEYVTIVLEAEDIDSQELFYAVTSLPDWLSLTDNIISGVASEEGFTTFGISVYDGEEIVNEVYELMVMTSVAVEHTENWNLVSLPLNVVDHNYLTLFPDAINGTLYEYIFSYQEVTTLVPGSGYWLRFEEPGSNSIEGFEFSEVTVSLWEGWNLIAGTSYVSEIVDPDGIVIPGTLYGYDDSGYYNSNVIEVGKAYWVRVTENGTITLISTGTAAKIPENSKLK